jgi:hypothetical protein
VTGTWFLIGFAIGFATIAAAVYRRGQHQINQQPWPLESDGIYDWAHDWDQAACDELEGWRT